MKSLKEFKPGLKIQVNDLMQRNYNYTLKEPVGKNFDSEKA
jgi:hypothetical protein